MSSLTYSPSRQARMEKLNTIMEDDSELGRRSGPIVSPVTSLTETISSYYQSVRYSSDANHWQWNELYDVSDDEAERQQRTMSSRRRSRQVKPRLQVSIRPASGATDDSNRDSWITDITGSAAPTRCPSMDIPSPRHWPTIEKFRKSQEGAITPTQLPISPLALSMLPAAPPAPSRTPSLDSLTSGETASSVPTTPEVGRVPADKVNWNHVDATAISDYASEYSCTYDEKDSAEIDVRFSTGVQLPQDALSFLQHLSVEIPAVEIQTAPEEEMVVEKESERSVEQAEMVEVPIKLSNKPTLEVVPQSATSEYSVSQLSIPSPGGFLASLDTGAARTWALPTAAEVMSAGPDSTVAEQFYNAPWNKPETVKEQIVEVPAQLQGPITAMKVQPTPATARPAVPTGKDYDDDYQTDLKKAAEMSMDRTSSWLMAQRDYIDERLSSDDDEVAKVKEEPKPKVQSKPVAAPSALHRRTSSAPVPKKKAVKFVDTEKANKEYKKGPLSSGSDPIFYQAFQHISNLSSPTDSFTARQARYDAVQARRSSVSKTHVASVLGNYRAELPKYPVPQRPISILPGNEPELTFEQQVFSQAERERNVLEQVEPSMWVVEALRYLSGGRLLNSPAANVLRDAPAVSHIASSDVRVLDLGGQPACDWAWHCAREFPHVKTYTATADARVTESAANLRGPSNHRHVAVENLWTLPFPDNHFDAVSARSLFAHLKANQRVAKLSQDQLDATLAECMRVLRPGGYLEFFVLDAEVVRGGPRGTAASVEFGYKLRQRGYEPNPTKAWLGRVRRAGFVDIKRAWMFLPMGALRDQNNNNNNNNGNNKKDMPPSPPPDASHFDGRIAGAEAVRGPVGSAADVAEVSGLVGSWLWEQWILKLEMEMGKPAEGDLGANVGGVVEEGRKTGSGWRSLSGWAKKPE